MAARVIVVFGTKGGVGKTVVATNLAVSLVRRRPQPTVCLVDLDLMAVGDVSKMLNLASPRTLIEVLPAFKKAAAGEERQTSALEEVTVTHACGLHVISALANPRQAHHLDPALLPAVFTLLKPRYDYIVVDGGRMFSEALVQAFDAANLILLVTSPDVIALYQTKWSLGMLESLLFPSMMVKGVLNRAESRGGVETKDVRAALPCEVIGEIPSDGRTVGMSVNQGVPLVVAFDHTKVAQAFGDLAQALVTRADLYVESHEIPRHRDGRPPGEGMPDRLAMPGGTLVTEDPAVVQEKADEIVQMKRRIHERLVEELDLKKLNLSALANQAEMNKLRQKTEQIIANLLAKEAGGVLFSHEVRLRLVKEMVDEALGLGPLEELLADPTITDILVNNKDQIYVERFGKLELTAKKFVTNDQVRTIIERIVAPIGRRIDESAPMVDARLPDGSRVNAIIPPLSVKGPMLSIRKFSRQRLTIDDLIRTGSLNQAMADFVGMCVCARKNIIVSGGTGSGKTTFLNILSAFIPEEERIVTIEDAAELRLTQTHWVSLESRPPNVEGKGQITVRDLFRNTLRMRPDRILIGECRGAETLDMLQAMNTGHDGSMTTVHANSPKDVISRLDSMVLMSNVELPIRAIREMTASAIHLIIHTARLSDGSRKVTAVSELTELVDGTDILFQDLFVFRQSGIGPDGKVLGEFTSTGKCPTFFDELKVKGIPISESMFEPTPRS